MASNGVQRLVYAPKAYIFIRSSNLGGKIYDVSSDVVRGSVTQKTGDVSTASFELRNRYQKWIRDPDSGNRSIFLPMDMVTIWLQRVAGRPVQVFTGYLDEVPYYQGYPGNAIFKATCTLKKLAFTWFDPGLQTFFQWVQTNDGWYFDPTTGEGLNAPALAQGTQISGTANLSPTAGTSKVTDTGFANLLGRFLTDIAGWSSNDVLISQMPADIPKLAAKLFATIQSDVQNDIKALEDYFATAMGIQGWVNPDPSTPSDSKGNPVVSAKITNLLTTMQKVADQQNVPLIVLALAAYIFTGFDDTYSVGPTENTSRWGYGIFALRPITAGQTTLPGQNADPLLASNLPISTTIGGKTPQQLQDVATSTAVFCQKLNSAQGAWVKGARNNDLASIQTWIEKAEGYQLPKVDITAAYNHVKQLTSSAVVVTPPLAAPNVSIDPANISFASAQVTKLLTAQEQKLVTAHYNSSKSWLAGLVVQAKQISTKLTITTPATKSATLITFTGPNTALQQFFNSLKGNSQIDQVSMFLAGANEAQVLRNGVPSNLGPASGGPKAATIAITQSKAPTVTAPPSTTSTTPSTQDGSASFQQLATFSANAAFAANFAFPTNVVESELLTGDRALMNDISCLDAVKQFCASSLRTFRSLPDGRFLAFYPDYFGAYRKPYWQIYNIELTDFGIQLNDDSLATHVYVVGDTFAGDGQITMEDDVSTRGVATITQAFMLDSFIEQFKPPTNATGPLVTEPIGRLQDAYTFLQHYGARPHKEEQPLIRNTFYEFLIAWQKFMYLWAQQFATNCPMTFQPEVMAGGLIEFPDHDVQMFCDQVTHEWDYESGFTTTAVLTSPSLTGTHNDRTAKPGFALGGNINTVGVE